MTREIPNKPHPTPNPDAPHVHGVPREKVSGSGSPPGEEVDLEELNFDSCLDDLSVVLAAAENQPDPVLQSEGTTQAPAAEGGKTAAPHTSEVFRMTYPPGVDLAGPPAETPRLPDEATPDPERAISRLPSKGWLASLLTRSHDDHDLSSEPGVPWFSLLLLTYASVLTLVLTWMVWTGRVFHREEPVLANNTHASANPVVKSSEPRKTQALPALSPQNIAALHATIQVGELEVTPVAIAVTPVDRLRSIDPNDVRREESPSLVLTLRLTNVSSALTFAPIERAFVRDQFSPLDRCLIETSDGARIGPFPLADDSEWSILGQEFPVLKPGESAQTIIASEPGAADRVRDQATWRMRVRIGPYRSDMIGVHFTKADLNANE